MSNVFRIPFMRETIQRDLFGSPDTHKYCWLDVAKLDQCKLEEVSEKFEATHILDTRSLPVFRRPKFYSPQLLHFFQLNSIEYRSISRLLDEKVPRLEIKNSFRNASLKNCLFLVFLFDSTEGASSDLKRIKTFLNGLPSLQEIYLSN